MVAKIAVAIALMRIAVRRAITMGERVVVTATSVGSQQW